MQVLDRTGVGTLWSICKTKFALKDHSHNYLPLSGGTLTGDLLFSNSGTTFRQIRGTCGDNDFWRIGGGATGNNAGYMEIATADDGTEPIYVRQYSGTFSTITRTATLLDGSGNTSFPGTVAAAKFKGALEGNASTASNASTVNGHTVNANVPSNAKFTDTNTWRPIQDNLTSTSTSESLSANQGRVLKGLVDGKANSSHTHNSLAAVGNEQISATAYGSGLHFKPYYSSGGPTTYGNILEYTSTNTGGGQLAMEWTGSQTESDGTDSNVGRVYYRSKRDNIAGWTKWMTLAYTNDIPTKLSQLTNDKGFVTGSVSGNTVTINGASTTWTNTWRGIQDNLTSSSTSDSLSANQGRILKGLVDGKANSSHTHTWSQISGAPATATRWPSWGEVTGKPGSFAPSSHTHDWSQITGKPDIKSWSETKSYIDSKVDSENNYPSYSLQSYIQSQLKQFGLTCRTYPCDGQQYDVGAKCGILINDNNDGIVSSLFRNNSLIQPSTFYSGIDTKICKSITELYGKTIYCIWNNYMIDVEYTGSPSSGFSLNVCFFSTLTGTTKKITVFTTNNNTGRVRDSAVACTYDNLYVANDRSLYVFDKSLNFKRYADFVPNQDGGIRYLFNYGDLGIFISTLYNGNYYCYKNGAISKYTDSVSSLKYTKNGHKYDLATNNYQLITDDLAIKSIVNDNYLVGNTLKKILFFIVDLQKNIEFQITIPVELFGISMTGTSEYLFTGVPVVEMYKYSTNNGDPLRYYVLVYKE